MKVSLNKIGVVYVVFVLAALGAIYKMVDLMFIHIPDTSLKIKTEKSVKTEGNRGSILADDGRYLAFSMPEYRICIDCVQCDSTYFYSNVDALGAALSRFYGDKTAAQYATALKDNRKAGSHYYIINNRTLTYKEMQEVCTFPILDRGQNLGGLIVEKLDNREYPYDSLAYRVLGVLKNNQKERSIVGIEGKYDSLLRGTNGLTPMKLTEHRQWIPDPDKEVIEPIDGIDIQTTINIDIQDITERALKNTLSNNENLAAGCAIVMDVSTGAIKAMSNLRREKDGSFTESFNYCIGQSGEPGSVFKITTLTVLLEDGLIELDTEMDANVSWTYHNTTFNDSYLRSYDKITVQRGFEISSNNVFRILAGKYYDKNPQEYFDKVAALHYTDNFDFDIIGLKEAKLRSVNDSLWSYPDLPQTGMGYAVTVTPLHTITYYNAIANGGVMMKPYLIQNYQKDGIISQTFEPEVVATVCSEETVKKLHQAMRGVVTNGTGETVFKKCKLNVAGKTGTARVVMAGEGYINQSGLHQHQATFVGFFPYENPQYTAIAVVYSAPTLENFYGATWAGPVVREIADHIYSITPKDETTLKPVAELPKYDLYVNNTINDTISGTPNVIGMGLKDGVNYLESLGYEVNFSGKGKISKQYPEPGTPYQGKRIELILTES